MAIKEHRYCEDHRYTQSQCRDIETELASRGFFGPGYHGFCGKRTCPFLRCHYVYSISSDLGFNCVSRSYTSYDMTYGEGANTANEEGVTKIMSSSRKRRGPAMTKEMENSTTSKILKLSTPSAKAGAVVEKHLKRKEERDALQYNVSKAKRTLKKESQLLQEHDEKSKQVLNRDLAVIEVEKERWEAMWNHELKATEQRVLELKEKKQDLKSFGEVLQRYREMGIGEDDVLAYMEACKPVASKLNDGPGAAKARNRALLLANRGAHWGDRV